MKVLFSWLTELCDLDRALLPEDAAVALIRGGLEIEAIDAIGGDLDRVVIAEVVATRPHPGADKLSLVDISAGEGVVQVVCGAPNVPAAGGRVLWAQPGAKLSGGRAIAARAVRGEDSAGMLCSEAELGIGADASGIAVVTGDVGADAVGRPAKAALGLADHVLDLSTPANRGDVLGHVGIARELCAQVGGRLRLPDASLKEIATAELRAAELCTVEIADPEGCPRYIARIIDGVRWAPSPLWLRRRLFACGIRPIAGVVDVTNYVLLELGHPLHAFDFAAAGGDISVRRAREGEAIVTLDDQPRTLTAGDLVICNPGGAIAVAGVMGGKATEAGAATTRILLESASFDAASIRRTARRLGLPSEASRRYERGVDPAGCELASARAAKLFAQVCGGAPAIGSVDAYPRPRRPRQITLRWPRAQAVLGIELSRATIADRFSRLGLEVADGSAENESVAVTCPTFRADISREIDLIDEIIRVVGFEEVPATLPPLSEIAPRTTDGRPARARAALCAAGMTETISYRFLPAARLADLGLASDDPRMARVVKLANPMSSEQAILRTTLVPNLLAQVAQNLNHGVTDIALFEVGTVFLEGENGPESLPHEAQHVAGVLCGPRTRWLGETREADFFDARGAIERVVAAVSGDLAHNVDIVAEPEPTRSPHLHPGIRAVVLADGARVGEIGEVHPAVRDRFGIEPRCVVFELALDGLPVAGVTRMQPIPRYPAIARDVSFYVAADVPAAAIAATIAAADQPLVESASPVEDYRHPDHVPAGKKAMLWTLRYRSPERTLTDAEVDAAHEAIVARLGAALDIARR